MYKSCLDVWNLRNCVKCTRCMKSFWVVEYFIANLFLEIIKICYVNVKLMLFAWILFYPLKFESILFPQRWSSSSWKKKEMRKNVSKRQNDETNLYFFYSIFTFHEGQKQNFYVDLQLVNSRRDTNYANAYFFGM